MTTKFDSFVWRPLICRRCGGKMVSERQHPHGADGSAKMCVQCDFTYSCWTTLVEKKAYIKDIRQFRAKNKGLT